MCLLGETALYSSEFVCLYVSSYGGPSEKFLWGSSHFAARTHCHLCASSPPACEATGRMAPVPPTFPRSNVSFSDLWGKCVGLVLWLRSWLLQDTYANKVEGHGSVTGFGLVSEVPACMCGFCFFLLFPILHGASLSVCPIVFKLQRQAWRGQPDRELSQLPRVLLLWLNNNLHIRPQFGTGPKGRVVRGTIFCPQGPDEAGIQAQKGFWEQEDSYHEPSLILQPWFSLSLVVECFC